MIPAKETVRRYVADAAANYKVTPDEILSRCRRKAVLEARIAVIRALKAHDPKRYTLTGMGRALGVNHTTILYWTDERRRQKHLARLEAKR